MHRHMRSHILLAGAVVVAGTAALLGSSRSTGSGTTAVVEGAPLDDTVAYANLAEKTPLPKQQIETPKAKTTIELLDLDHVTRVGDHYEAPMKDGRHAILTLDPDLQELAEKLLDESRAPRGAIVALDPDGRVLALAGRRTEENTGSPHGTFDWRLATDTWAPAASIFKLVTASALVTAGVQPDDKVCYHGGLRSVSESNLKDSKSDNRCESLAYGVAHSNNAIVGKLAFQKLSPVDMIKAASALGLDKEAELGPLAKLALPTTHDLAFAQTAAGFAGADLSVLGGALLAATFADDGKRPAAQIVASIDGVAVVPPAKTPAITSDTARAVAKMMVMTCDVGSAARSFGKHRALRVAGKTGTLTKTEPFYIEHSWFVGYAPAEQPRIIVSVLLGNAENWHLRGHEAAKRLIDRAIGRAKDRTPKI